MFLASLYRGVRLAVFACTLAISGSVVSAQTVALSGHMPPILRSAQRLNRVAASEQISLALVLPLRNQDQLADLLHRLYTPGDLMYGKYLTSSQFTQQFAPTPADYQTVIAFAQSQGLTVTNTHPNRTIVDVVGDAQLVEQAFGVQLNQYQVNGRVFRAPNNEPQIPVQLAGRLAAVVGLDTATLLRTYNREKTAAPQGVVPQGVVPQGGTGSGLHPRQTGSGPGGALAPSDIKTAYNLNGINANGAGQTLGLFELDGYNASDISSYENYFGLPNVPLQNVLIDGYNGGAGSNSNEVTLDIELQIALAPSISKIYVYEGPNNGAGIVDTYNRIATDNLAKSVSTSWGQPENSSSSSIRNTENQAFQQMAAQGQSIFAAAGDWGAYDNGSSLSVDDPASQPYMTGVGGTSLTTNGPGGAWKSETTWNGGSVSGGAGGGGISTIWAKPSYQANFGLSSSFRNVPDVSLDADPNNGYSTFFNGGWTIFGGTSCAAPLWSAFVACVNQGRAAAGKNTVGFANPLIYQLGAGGNYGTDYHDIADNSTNLYYHATTGYDNATGWGTINGAGLYPDMVNGGAFTPITAPAAPTNLQATAGNAQVGLSWTTVPGATSYNVYRSTTSGSSYAAIGTATSGSYTDTTVTNGTTYYYVVTAVNAGGESPKSAQVSATPTAPITAPTAPTNLQATAGNAQVGLSWTTVTGATSYNVYRSTTSGSSYTAIGTATTGSYTNTGLTNGTTYYYVVTAVNAGGESPKSAQVSATPTAPIMAPTAPTNLQATAGNAQVGLSWTTVTGAASYKIYRSTTSGSNYTAIGTATSGTYTDTGLTNGTTYYYVVTAVNAGGESPKSAQASATPSAPQSTTVYKIHAGPGTIGSFNPDNYFTGGSLYTVTQNIDTSAANAAPMAVYQTQRFGNFSYVMPNLTPGAPYTVRLHFAESYFTIAGQRYFNVAINGATVLSNFDIATAAGAVNKAIVEQFNTTADSGGNITITFLWQTNWPLVNGVEILASASNTAPSAPTNVKATAGNAQVGLSWSASYGATSYNIYRSTTSGSGFAVVGNSTTTSYTDTSVTNGTTYYYVVTAVNASGESAQSTPVSATPTAVTAAYKIHAGPGTIGSFNPDSYFTGGSLYTVTQNIDTSAANAAPMAVYQTQRFGNFAYVMPNLTPGATYTVRLHFAESYFTIAGQRYFNVAINGATVLSNFDIATAAGAVNKAIVEQFTATADSNGKITITFLWQTNWPLVNAVEILH